MATPSLRHPALTLLAALALPTTLARAEVPPDPDPQATRAPKVERLPEIEVIGRLPGALESVPGSAAVVDEEDLTHQAPTSANEALRVLPGVNLRDEEGIGLRPNIGIRGLNPDRSRTLLVLEDGVPISLAPYGEPELYYAPSIERMQRLELVKGSGSILFGPQTIGGVLNYITIDPPEKRQAVVELRYGSHDYFLGRASIGDTTVDGFGYLFTVAHQRFGGHRGLNLELTEVHGKLKLRLSPTSHLGVKVGVYDEVSHATYLGLTTPQYEHDPNTNYAIHDVLPVRRVSASVSHSALLGDAVQLQTHVYFNQTTRNWTRQDFDRAAAPGRTYERIIDGQGRDITGADSFPDDGSAVFFRNTTGSRNRAFTVFGVEPRLTWDWSACSCFEGELIAGVRLHGEVTAEQRLDGTTASAISGNTRADERRYGQAFAAYLQNRFIIFERLKVTPGLRLEAFWHEREILRLRVDGTSTDLDPPRTRSSEVIALIPGLGLSYAATEGLTLFGGVHRGFAPPRTKDAITNDGQNLELEAEHSWNFELGVRFDLARKLSFEVAGFYLDFENQVIAPTEASGVLQAGADGRALINGGATTHAGVEAAVTVDPAGFADADFKLPITLAYTFVHAEFGAGWSDDLQGNRLPYAPEHVVSAQARFVHASGLSLQLNGHYQSEQFHDAKNTVGAAVNGTNGRIDGRFLMDARVAFAFEPTEGVDLELYLLGKNLTDATYIASRAPQGIQPGMPRQVIGGVRGAF